MALAKGYNETFKGVTQYANWIKKRTYTTDRFENLFHRVYHSRNSHHLRNWLVQGSGGDLLLIKMRESYEYLKTHPWWDYVLTVHDEVDFAVRDDIPNDQIKKEIKEIQQLMRFDFDDVSVISDIEVTSTDWGHKQDYEEALLCK